MSVKLLSKTQNIHERKALAASIDMFEIWIDGELVLWPIEKADKYTKQNHQFYKTMYRAAKLFSKEGLNETTLYVW